MNNKEKLTAFCNHAGLWLPADDGGWSLRKTAQAHISTETLYRVSDLEGCLIDLEWQLLSKFHRSVDDDVKFLLKLKKQRWKDD